MGKKKSAVILILITILILGLCFMCTVSFSYGTDKMKTFDSVVNMMGKDAKLGAPLADGENYRGGGYTAVYYPDGVISAEEYEKNCASLKAASEADAEDQEKADAYTDYRDGYLPYGSLYLEKESVCGGADGTEPTEEFLEKFDSAVELFRARYGRLNMTDVTVAVTDGLSVKVFLPDYGTAQAVIINYFSYTGEFSLTYGSSPSTATGIEYSKKDNETVRDYVKGASWGTNGSTAYVAVRLTSKGKDVLSNWTQGAASSAITLYFNVGDEQVISLSISEQVTSSTIYVSGSYTSETAKAVATTIDSAINGAQTDLGFTVGSCYRSGALFGDLALTLLYIGFGVLFVAMMAFFFIRYRSLAVVHLYTFLLWLFLLIIVYWGVGLHIGIEIFLALVLSGALLSVSNAYSFECARKEYSYGKTMASSVKAGYKRCLWPLLDAHGVLALFAVLVYAIGITELHFFGLALVLGVVFSALGTLAVNRLHWAAMMSFAKDKGKFCNFKREDDDDE